MDDAELERLAASEPVDSDAELFTLLKRVRDAERERSAKAIEGFVTDQPRVGVSYLGEGLAKVIREGK